MNDDVVEYIYPKGKFINGDCLEKMKDIPDNSIDMILCDLPYGTTQNKWDLVINFEKLWTQYWRIAKENCPIVLTSSQPFTTNLIISSREYFRYSIVWDKTKGGGFVLAKKQPMKSHEDICIFYKKQPTYNPQMEIRGNIRKKGGGRASANTGIVPRESWNNEYYPLSIVKFSTASRIGKFHPTQKPVELFEYLIKTYTNKHDTVLDNCAGSGTTAVAAINTRRNWVCIEKEREYFDLAVNRIDSHIEDLINA
jgi:site-specific DNA-methyltransferase (adenine-specific)